MKKSKKPNFNFHEKSKIFREQSQSSSAYIPKDFMKPKAKWEVDKQKKKFQKFRNRDFTSQILTLPGAKTISNRPLEEKRLVWKKKFELRKINNQAYTSPIDRRFKVGNVPKSHPSHKNREVKLDPTVTRKGYAMKNFILKEKYDFLNPGKY